MRATITFQLKKGGSRSGGLCPVYLRVTLCRKRVELSTRIRVDPKTWDAKGQRVKGKSQDTKVTISRLGKIYSNAYENYPGCQSKGKLLPVLSNQKMNSYLKELADICEIQKKLTMHVARHTFATSVTLTNGVPIETFSKMLGHTSIKTTQIYARIVDSKIASDMKMVRSKFRI